MPTNAIEVENLHCGYGRGRKRKTAVDGLSFAVAEGQCVGFIGPNGAGKSTTIKTLMGFMFPWSGAARVFGRAAGSVASRRRIGYLPEVSLYYPFMKARELLELYGGLQEVPRATLAERIPRLLEVVGLGGREGTLLRNFSKGMQQRLGIAQALVADPDLLIFDELSSGLDPLGRHDLREVLLDLKRRGKTIFFSSHELYEVEALCDRVVMIHQGKKIADSPVADVIEPLSRYEIVFAAPDAATAAEWTDGKATDAGETGAHAVQVETLAEFTDLLSALKSRGADVRATREIAISLEDYFMNLIRPNDAKE